MPIRIVEKWYEKDLKKIQKEFGKLIHQYNGNIFFSEKGKADYEKLSQQKKEVVERSGYNICYSCGEIMLTKDMIFNSYENDSKCSVFCDFPVNDYNV